MWKSKAVGIQSQYFDLNRDLRPKAEKIIPTRPNKCKSSLADSKVMEQNLFKCSQMPYGYFMTKNLATVTLRSAHAWQNVDRMPWGSRKQKRFCLFSSEDTFLSLCTRDRRKINRALSCRKTAFNQRSWAEFEGLIHQDLDTVASGSHSPSLSAKFSSAWSVISCIHSL